jgi:hypothetical protein
MKVTFEQFVKEKDKYIGGTVYGREYYNMKFDLTITDIKLEDEILTIETSDGSSIECNTSFAGNYLSKDDKDSSTIYLGMMYIGGYEIYPKINVSAEAVAECTAWLPNLSKEDLQETFKDVPLV